MKSYEVGGASDDSCMETVMVDGKPKRRRKKKCGAGKTKRVFSAGEIGKGVAKVAAGTAAVIGGLAANKKYGLVDKAKQALGMKKGGTIKRTAKKK